jgi:peptidoglycan-N-acetylglucosamine deacetylase
MSAKRRHAFTIDLEDWFCSHNLRAAAPYETWAALESRIERNTDAALAFLSEHGIQATFFVLGWIAERHPDLVAAIAAEGHEIGTHGYRHEPLTVLTRDAFEADLRRSLEVLGDLTTEPVVGYRAPAFSVTRSTWWALDVLRGCGVGYDSSVYPFASHPDYGVRGGRLDLHRHRNGLIEAPLSCARYGPWRVPCGGGAYLRLFPYRVYRRLVERCVAQGRPLVFYVHPWEWDTGMPRLATSRATRVRHYANTGTVRRKLAALVGDFQFTSLRNVLAERGLNPA